MTEPVVQIIIPVYNSEKFLKRCLDSLLNQSFSAWQAILIDDASTDGSFGMIEEYMNKDSRFTCIRQSVNSGASQARNAAFGRLSAEYTAFLDADDFWESRMLERMIATAEEKNSDVVQCRFIYDFKNGKTVLPKGAFKESVSLRGDNLKAVYLRMMTGINMNHVCMKLIRTTLVKELSFDTSLKTAEDLKFCIELFKDVDKYDFIDEPLYHYFRNNTSLTGSSLSFFEKFYANREASLALIDALPEYGIDNIFYRTLAYLRPYLIIVSKIKRMISEKIFSK